MGETPQKTKKKIEDSMGGVLFVDEAHNLYEGDKGIDYGKEALKELMVAMENNRGLFSVIMAGYPNEMENLFKADPGLKDRLSFKIHISDYNNEELWEIFNLFMKKEGIKYEDDLKESVMIKINELKNYYSNNNLPFANARSIRERIVESVKREWSNRLDKEGHLSNDDFNIKNHPITKTDIKNIKF